MPPPDGACQFLCHTAAGCDHQALLDVALPVALVPVPVPQVAVLPNPFCPAQGKLCDMVHCHAMAS